MWSRQIFVAVLCKILVWQQVAAVVNNSPLKVEETNKSTSDTTDISTLSTALEVVIDSVPAASEDKNNRRESSISDTYGAPLAVGAPTDSYLPAEPSNPNLPVPIYGVPDIPSNNVVYPEPPPDIPPPAALQSTTYGLPPLTNTYGPPPKTNYLVPSNNYGPPSNTYGPPVPPLSIYGPPSNTYGPPGSLSNTYGLPTRPFPGRGKPIYGPPRLQYGPPGKPLSNVKFGYKFKNFGGSKFSSKPLSTYGPPVGYFKDNYNPVKLSASYSNVNIPNHGNSFSGGGINTNFGVPNIDLSGVKGISNQYGVPDLGLSSHGGGNLISIQYGPPDNDILGSPIHQYGPPQPSSHPRPPHPGAPAPPTPPDIKYDGWQPIPGLVSRKPDSVYGAPSGEHVDADLSYNSDLSPPPAQPHFEQQSNSHASVANLELDNSFGPSSQKSSSDSYGAPLNTVTGSGGVVSTSGEEAHGHQSHHDQSHHEQSHQKYQSNVNFGLSALGLSDQNINTVKSIGYEIFPSGSSGISEGQLSGSYGAPPSPSNTYTSHSYSSVSFSPSHSHSHGSFNSFKNYGYKGMPISSSGIGLIPPNGLYGAPSGSYGTPLFSKPKLGPSKYPGPPPPSSHYGGPISHSPVSYLNINHGSTSGLSSYNAPLNIVDGSYNQPQVNSVQGEGKLHGANDLVGLDYSHPSLTIDLTRGNGLTTYNTHTSSHDCKLQSLPSLSYGVPSANSYTAALSSLTTNIGNNGVSILSTYGAPEPLPLPQAQIGLEPKPHDTYGVPDLSASHSQKINSEVKANSIETDYQDSQGKSYGKTVAASFGPSSELVQSESIDFNNIPLQGALGSYTLQIQSTDNGQTQVPHGQVLNDGLLQSILAAIEQPKGNNAGQPIIQLQKSLEQQQFVTNDTISSVVEQLTDDEIRQGTQLAKDEILKTSELSDEQISGENQYSSTNSKHEEGDTKIQYSSPNQYIISATNNVEISSDTTNIDTNDINLAEPETTLLKNNGMALYFSNTQRIKKDKDDSKVDLENNNFKSEPSNE